MSVVPKARGVCRAISFQFQKFGKQFLWLCSPAPFSFSPVSSLVFLAAFKLTFTTFRILFFKIYTWLVSSMFSPQSALSKEHFSGCSMLAVSVRSGRSGFIASKALQLLYFVLQCLNMIWGLPRMMKWYERIVFFVRIVRTRRIPSPFSKIEMREAFDFEY